ncbi:MAG: sulfatase [Candidatus Poribacteria bacterium]|nr:sulfatase [Candidatus Poribacteria bacterium]
MKNIIAVITDTFRYDNLGQRAERPIRTPALDKFAAERATAIEKFYMNSFPTIPHRTDFATGVLGWPHYGWQPIDQSGPNHVAQLLGQVGYTSQLICDCPHLFNCRFQQGFDAAFQHRGQEGDKPLLHLNDPIETVVPDDKTRTRPIYRGHTLVNAHRWVNRYYQYEADTFPAKTAGTAIRWLEENSQSDPFFLWVDLFDPHEPWDPPEYLVRRYDPDYTGTPMLHPNYGPSSAYTPAELQNLWAHYAAESELVDRFIGRILQKIDDLELWEDTIVAVMSDHGMSLGEHGRTGKSNIHEQDNRYWPAYPEVGHELFLIAGGDIPRGESRDVIAQPIDILPTLCNLAGVTVEPPKPFDGISFADAVLGDKSKHREYAVTGCHIRAQGGAPPRKATTPFLITDRWGYAPVGPFGQPELYDLTVDPLAANDLAAGNADVIKEVHELFMAHLSDHRAPEDFLSLWEGLSEGDAGGGIWAIDYSEETI